jgi:hypothetical protein
MRTDQDTQRKSRADLFRALMWNLRHQTNYYQCNQWSSDIDPHQWLWSFSADLLIGSFYLF